MSLLCSLKFCQRPKIISLYKFKSFTTYISNIIQPKIASKRKYDCPQDHQVRMAKIELGSEVELKIFEAEPYGILDVDSDELDLERTLLGGQSFRWTKDVQYRDGSEIFTGVVQNHALQLWRISPQQIGFKSLNNQSQEIKLSTIKMFLEDYFQLKYSLRDLYADWSSRDPNLAKCCENYKGFRILRQDPSENVFSFICATNNNIKRISLMIDKLCKRFGDPIGRDPVRSSEDSYRLFPSIERMAEDDVFKCLRYELGFGYRAKFITETAKLVVKQTQAGSFKSNKDFLLSLRNLPYKETCNELMKFPGIGRKVADCICLMSMDHLNSVPIDCHIYEIVCRDYIPNLRQKHKTLTEKVHDMIGRYFIDLHGPLAGWSTSVLFIAELKHLKVDKQSKVVRIKKEREKKKGKPKKTK